MEHVLSFSANPSSFFSACGEHAGERSRTARRIACLASGLRMLGSRVGKESVVGRRVFIGPSCQFRRQGGHCWPGRTLPLVVENGSSGWRALKLAEILEFCRHEEKLQILGYEVSGCRGNKVLT
jgi:hypothetical protein